MEAGGTITPANASTLNDGASALVLAGEEYVRAHGLRPLARILSYADAAQAPEWFTTSPSIALPKALAKAGLGLDAVDYFEINEAYAAVALANRRLLGIDPDRLNVFGGGVALGHPLGNSGSRIVTTLLSVLADRDASIGAAGICNGGGGASALVVEREKNR